MKIQPHRRILAFLGLALASASVAPLLIAHAEEQQVEEIDYLALAARLLSDGHVDRAKGALSQVNMQAPGLDLHRYHLVSGLVALREKAYPAAAQAFRKAIATPPMVDPEADEATKKAAAKVDPQLYYYLAQAEFGAEQYKKVLEALDKVGDALADNENLPLLRAQAHYALGQKDAAFNTLSKAQKRFPKVPQFERLEVFWLIDLGLYQAAAEAGRHYVTRETTTVDDHIAIGEALRRGHGYKLAAEVLEAAHLMYPENDKVLLALAHVYVDLDQKFAAAMVLEDAARLNPKYTVEAAELYRQAKMNARALFINARVEDQKAKFRQRMSILLDDQQFERVAAMAPTIERLGLLEDDQIRYAMAYGFFKTGDFNGAERYLRGIKDASLFESAGGLRRAMRSCEPTDWSCN